MISGRAHATVAGNTVSAWAVKKNPRIKLSYLHSTGLVWAAPVRKDDQAMRKLIEDAIECMKLDGTIAALHETRSEEHTSELQSLMRISYAVFCLKKNTATSPNTYDITPDLNSLRQTTYYTA